MLTLNNSDEEHENIKGGARAWKRLRIMSSSDEDLDETSERKRKRIRNIAKHAQNIRKTKRNSGREYISRSLKVVREKKIENKSCNCSRKCEEKLSFEERTKNFESFWKLEDFSKQNILLAGNVVKQKPKQRRPRSSEKPARKYSNAFFLTNADSVKVQVCKQFFLDTFKISNGRLTRVLHSETHGVDLRGKMPGSSRKTCVEKVRSVKEHIESFPSDESHYTRAHHTAGRKFLNPNLDVTQMYALYKEKCEENTETCVNLAMYRKIFNTEFNLHFRPPRKDTCQKCDLLNVQIQSATTEEERANLQETRDLHLQKAELARNTLKDDQKTAMEDPNHFYAFSFDLQKALPYPKLSVSAAYYKRNMYVYNLGFHNFHNKNVTMYVWDETIASRGSQEVASCIIQHIKNITTQKHLLAYSDACGGQNRNIKVALTWMKIVQSSNIEVIDHKFLVSGHSFLPNDRDFGVIEMKSKKTEYLYIPQNYYILIEKCCKRNPFNVKRMNQSDFITTKEFEKLITRRKKNTEGESVVWLEIQWMRFLKKDPYKIFYKTSLDKNDKFHVLDLSPKKGRPTLISNIQFPLLYNSRIPISQEKYKDMSDLLKYIPPIYHEYYKTLPTENVAAET